METQSNGAKAERPLLAEPPKETFGGYFIEEDPEP
jgi:hypothetical protein